MPTISPEPCPYRSLAQAVRRLPPTRGDRPVHVSTLTRWITRGVRAADGSIVKLDARRFPGGWKVTDEALDLFLEALTHAALGRPEPAEAPIRTPSRRRAAELARVDRALDAARICDRSQRGRLT
jgi:hypothetical protein